jgi:hypothetical protein
MTAQRRDRLVDSPKLILIDGIAGSGKSTTGQRLYRALRLAGHKVEFYHEFCRPHPVLGVEADPILDWLDQSLSAWRQFGRDLNERSGVAILDGALFQCGVGELLVRGANDQEINEFDQRVEQIVEFLGAALIHLYQEDIELALRRVYDQRTAAWRQRVEESFAGTAYGRARSLSGFDLYLDFNRSLRRLSDRAFTDSKLPKLAIENSDQAWDSHFERIRGFLSVSQCVDPFDPAEFCGEYEEEGTGRRCRIKTVNDVLRVDGLFDIPKNLLPNCDGTVFVQSWPDELTFRWDGESRVVSFQSTGPWDRLGDGVWTRVDGLHDPEG